MVITLSGENTYAIRQTLRQIKADFIAAHGVNAVEQLDGAAITPAYLRTQLNALSLFAPERLIILRDPSTNKELFAELGNMVDNVAEGVTLVLVDGILDKRTKAYKALKSGTDFRELPMLGEAALQKWVNAEVQALGGTITPQAAQDLVAKVGADQWQLAGDIKKLVAFAPAVTEETIALLVAPNLETSAFALLDAVMAGNEPQSRKLLQQLKTRSDPYEFFGLLVWQAQAVAVASAAPRGMRSAELAAASGLKPFVVQKSQALASRLGLANVKRMVAILADLDVQLKSSGVEPWLLVEQALAKITPSAKAL